MLFGLEIIYERRSQAGGIIVARFNRNPQATFAGGTAGDRPNRIDYGRIKQCRGLGVIETRGTQRSERVAHG